MHIATIKNNYNYQFYSYKKNDKWFLQVYVSRDWLYGEIMVFEMWNEEITKHSFLHSEIKKQLLVVNKYKNFLLGI